MFGTLSEGTALAWAPEERATKILEQAAAAAEHVQAAQQAFVQFQIIRRISQNRKES
jgi:hypothetical protein